MVGTGGSRRISQTSLSKTLVMGDDWRVVEDPVERKKMQNRSRQRVWREKKRQAMYSRTTAINAESSWKGYGMLIVTDQHDDVGTKVSCLIKSSPSMSKHHMSPNKLFASVEEWRRRSKKDKLIPPILTYSTYATLGQTPPPITFPLSADHCLITLVQYNVVRALVFNMAILSILDYLPPGCSDDLGVPSLEVTPVDKIPPDLQYTPLQRSTPHEYWISAFPFPAMRDNFISLAGQYDSRDLFQDLVQGLYEGLDDAERRGFLVWGQSWRMHGWEVSEGFVNKWGFLLKGCPELIESTNHWRETRGDDTLIIEI